MDAIQKGIVENQELNSIIRNLACVKLKGRTLILVERIQHGDILNSLIPNSLWVKGEDNADTRKEVIKQLNEAKEDVVAIATTGIFNTGISTFIHNLINAAGGKADHLVVQKIGRGLRVSKDKKELNYFDFYFENNDYLEKHSKKRVDVISKLGHSMFFYETYDDFISKKLFDD
jgi:superfamily II DNA or RNA helicase